MGRKIQNKSHDKYNNQNSIPCINMTHRRKTPT